MCVEEIGNEYIALVAKFKAATVEREREIYIFSVFTFTTQYAQRHNKRARLSVLQYFD